MWAECRAPAARLEVAPTERLHAQEAAHRQPRSDRTEEQAEPDQDERRHRERQRLHVWVAGQRAAHDRLERDLLAEDEEQDREQRPAEAAEETLDHERAADEPVRRADELHHLDLTPPREDR